MRDERTAVLLDEQPIWLDALERMLSGLGVTAVGKLTSTSQALTMVGEQRPHLFILDTDMNGSIPDGLTCLREAVSRVPTVKAVVVSTSNDPERIGAALGAGACAYVLKRAQPEDLAAAIRQVFSPSLYFATGHELAPSAPSTDVEKAGLTRREREILSLVAEGSTNGQVARTLWVTEQTVKFHLANIFRKLDVTNRTQASRWAHMHGLIAQPAEQAPVEVLA